MAEDTWGDLAAGWQRWRNHLDTAYRPVRTWLVTHLELRSGQTLLELAAGTGSAGFDAAAAIDGPVRLTSTDLASQMVDAARQRGTELRLHDAEFRVMDAARITLDSHSLDRVLCESGFMLMPDPAAALRESRRVLRPNGRLAFSVWGPPERNPWDTIADDLLVDLGHLPPPRRDTLGSRMAHEQYTRALLHEAGFDSVHTAEVAVQFSFSDLDEWERWSIDTNSTGHAIRALSTEGHDTFRARLASAFAPYRTARGYELPGVALCAAAT